MKISEAFPSKWLKAADLKGREREVQIESCTIEQIKAEADPELVIYFANTSKGLVCNTTNRLTLVDAFGDETEGWTSKKVVLFTIKTTYKGSPCDGLRVRVPQEMPPDDEPFAI